MLQNHSSGNEEYRSICEEFPLCHKVERSPRKTKKPFVFSALWNACNQSAFWSYARLSLYFNNHLLKSPSWSCRENYVQFSHSYRCVIMQNSFSCIYVAFSLLFLIFFSILTTKCSNRSKLYLAVSKPCSTRYHPLSQKESTNSFSFCFLCDNRGHVIYRFLY